jgi:hypothetical protein
VIAGGKVDGEVFVGAEAKRPGQTGALPDIDVPDMEVDNYYRTNDGVLHADEVKDTPNAATDKIKAGAQTGRYATWVGKDPGKRHARYVVRAEGPKFDTLMDPTVVANLNVIQSKQPGLDTLEVGGQGMNVARLEALMKAAFAHINEDKATRSKPAYYTVKFASLLSTRETLGM